MMIFYEFIAYFWAQNLVYFDIFLDLLHMLMNKIWFTMMIFYDFIA